MKQSFYVYNNGDLKRKDNTLQFTNYNGEKRDIPIERISDIYVMSEMSFNTKFINYISQYGIPMHFFNYYNFYTGKRWGETTNYHLCIDSSVLGLEGTAKIIAEFAKQYEN